MKFRSITGPKPAVLIACTTAIAMILGGDVGFAAKGGEQGPPVGGETPNNLSHPSVRADSVLSVAHHWNPPLAAPELGEHYSYGCDAPETMDQFSYPNTSCVDNLADPGTYYDAAVCTAADMPCEGLDVHRIYWQKVDANEWWADEEGAGGTGPLSVDYVNWGDALEAVSWNERSVIRVETQPYENLVEGFDPYTTWCAQAASDLGLDPALSCRVGQQMWHVSGQGITEKWGVRATDLDAGNLSFNYDSPFQIIKSTTARLNIAKLEPLDALCSQPGGNPGEDPPADVGPWVLDPDSGEGQWQGSCVYHDDPFTVELSVSGKYVFGYNWRMKYTEPGQICGEEWLKTGFWRLTFYDPESILFDDPAAPNVAPPMPPSAARVLPRAPNDFIEDKLPPAEPPEEPVLLLNGLPVIESSDPGEDDRLYKPVIDEVNNLTYIDICIVAKSGGGKR